MGRPRTSFSAPTAPLPTSHPGRPRDHRVRHRHRHVHGHRRAGNGAGAHGIVVDPTSRHAYVTNLYADTVAVLDLDLDTLKVVATGPVGDTPNGISFSPAALDKPPATTAVDLPVFGSDKKKGDAHTEGEGHDAH